MAAFPTPGGAPAAPPGGTAPPGAAPSGAAPSGAAPSGAAPSGAAALADAPIPGIRLQMSAADWAILGVLSILWGGSFLFMKIAVQGGVPPLTVVWLRVALAAIVLWAWLMATGGWPRLTRQQWLALGVMGLFNSAIPFFLIVWAQQHIDAGLAAILNATTPFWAILVAHVATQDERLSWRRALGVAVGVVGVAVMLGLPLLAGASGPLVLLAELAVLGAALNYGVSVVFGRRFRTWGVRPAVVATGQITAAAMLLLGPMLVIDRPLSLPWPGLPVVAAIAALAVASTAVAYLLFFRLLAGAGAVNVALVTLLVPVTAILLGVLLANETLTTERMLGRGLIALGLGVMDGRLLRLLRARPATATR